MRKYTFVTVVPQIDYRVLCYQAQSMAKYLPASLVQEIIVIENDGFHVPKKHLLRQYGNLAKFVKIIDRSKVSSPEIFKIDGWYSQQILKLEIAKHIQSDRYVVLDSKNILIREISLADFENSKGEPRMFQVDYRKHSSINWLKNCIRYWRIDDCTAKFVPTTTPFIL